MSDFCFVCHWSTCTVNSDGHTNVDAIMSYLFPWSSLLCPSLLLSPDWRPPGSPWCKWQVQSWACSVLHSRRASLGELRVPALTSPSSLLQRKAHMDTAHDLSRLLCQRFSTGRWYPQKKQKQNHKTKSMFAHWPIAVTLIYSDPFTTSEGYEMSTVSVTGSSSFLSIIIALLYCCGVPSGCKGRNGKNGK